MFSKKVLDTRLEEVARFYRAFYRAAMKINGSPEAYRDYLVEKMNFPRELRDTYRFIRYRRPGLPSSAQIERVLAWLGARRLLETAIRAEDLMDSRPLDRADL
jgi:ABC-type nitrate/sulfonate/bicarbonate transport system substrate-binding protein